MFDKMERLGAHHASASAVVLVDPGDQLRISQLDEEVDVLVRWVLRIVSNACPS